MKTSDAFPSRYLQTATVKAKPIVATISNVEMELVGQGADQKHKPVLHLEGEKSMVLNRTNFETLANAFGDSDEWAGQDQGQGHPHAVRGQVDRRSSGRANRAEAGAEGRAQ
jgi:hypothetical protein